MNLLHIESRLSRQNKADHEFYVEYDSDQGSIVDAIKHLRDISKSVHVLSSIDQVLDESGMCPSMLKMRINFFF